MTEQNNEMEAALDRVEKETGLAENVTEYEYIEYKLDGRGQPVIDENGKEVELERFTFRAEDPHEGQLTFLMASMGRGQTTQQRIAAVVNFLDAVLDDESADYLNSRLLSRDNMIPPEAIEKIFRAFTEAWFGRPTK